MAAQTRTADTQDLQEELPGDARSKTVHESVVAPMVEVRLSTGQGTTDSEMVLVCDLWIGEGTLYDPSTRTEINVWFDKGQLHLTTRGCTVKPGTRFKDQLVPDQPKTIGSTKIKTTFESELGGGTGFEISSEQSILTGHVNAEVSGRHKTSRTTSTEKDLEIAEFPTVSVTGDMWEVRPTGIAMGTSSSISSGCRRFRYIDVNDRLCDLDIRTDVRRVEVNALFFVYPSALHYRIKTQNAVARFRNQLSLNQSKIVDLLIKKGVPKHDQRGLQVARASLRRRKIAAEKKR